MLVRASDPLARYVRVRLNGADVTELCAAADDRAGWVELVVILPGSMELVRGEDDKPLVLRVAGMVEIVVQRPLRCLACGFVTSSVVGWVDHVAGRHVGNN